MRYTYEAHTFLRCVCVYIYVYKTRIYLFILYVLIVIALISLHFCLLLYPEGPLFNVSPNYFWESLKVFLVSSKCIHGILFWDHPLCKLFVESAFECLRGTSYWGWVIDKWDQDKWPSTYTSTSRIVPYGNSFISFYLYSHPPQNLNTHFFER